MITIKNREQCCGCGACAQICPKQCITMTSDEEGFLYPLLDTEQCVFCGRCERACPVLQKSEQETDRIPQAYAAYNKNEQIRMESSSGGVFTAFAEHILDNGGVVFGAAMTPDCRHVRHIVVEDKDLLTALRGSKYLQSEIGETYCQAKQLLEQGREVLFSGTPCQIEGLKAFLRRPYEGLTCVDVICHGVPSQKVWEFYVDYREKCAGVPARRTIFRHKKYGWKSYALFFDFSENKAYEQILRKDLFLQTFLRNVCLRPSCYQCAFKKLNHVSDVTLADFWGCNRVCPDLDDDRGLSLILTHSEKGAAFLNAVSLQLIIRQVDMKQSISGNLSMIQSCSKPIQRDLFMSNSQTMFDVERWPNYWPRIPLSVRIKACIPDNIKNLLRSLWGVIRKRS